MSREGGNVWCYVGRIKLLVNVSSVGPLFICCALSHYMCKLILLFFFPVSVAVIGFYNDASVQPGNNKKQVEKCRGELCKALGQ